ncbi:hypothetical protein GAP32_343 [Cronobacter phage vB_CsaM_GAP32]|uniref:Uncharacterized protein n=1 Tax=Cronobacter phage vB_CsaM_GAP32 TaxID=1141136 RepID=K4F704_9CAUD|nr:hypothetical protein GAP32_343 [Cronobacter phage vB_CsaM_GAP32]AFC21793.1 hypothetical protein GAP32_343 [Cronobacter phage vB_CsaM_GAP32]
MNTIKVQIKTVLLGNCKYDVDLYNVLTKELQNDTIVSYVLSPSKIFAYVVQSTDDFGITIESNGVFHHIDDIYNKFLSDFPNVLLETLKYDDIAVEIIHSDEDEPTFGENFDESNLSNEELKKASDEFNSLVAELAVAEYETKISGTELIEDIISAFDAIENNLPYAVSEPTKEKIDSHEMNVNEMKKVIQGLRDVGETLTMAEAVQGTEKVEVDITNKTMTLSSESELDSSESELDSEELAAYSIGDTVVETVTLKVALISFNAFDDYASKHNIVGWDLLTPTTLLIKYMEDGSTSEEKIKKFHEMMDSLDTGWVDKTSNDVKFLSELHQVFERDLTEEFLGRVKKHNTFVRENLAKIRAALLDMEADYEKVKDEVNLTIDWETLTAFASKKERTENRIKGVETGYNVENRFVNGKPENIVRVNTGLSEGDFYIPLHLLTNEIREKYVLENHVYYIDDVPDYAFYEVAVNGHFMIIEKTDL